MLPSDYEYLGDSTSSSEGPYAIETRFFRGRLTYGFQIDAAALTSTELPPLSCTGFGYFTIDDAKTGAVEALKKLVLTFLSDASARASLAAGAAEKTRSPRKSRVVAV